MKKFFLAAFLVTVLGLVNISGAALVHYGFVSNSGDPDYFNSGDPDYSKILSVAEAGDGINVKGLVSEKGYVIVGESVNGLASALTLYVTNTDNNDTFRFTLVGLDSNKDFMEGRSSTETIATGNTKAMTLQAGAYSHVGVMIQVVDKEDADVFNTHISTVPEPMTVSTLALGSLALLRKNRK